MKPKEIPVCGLAAVQSLYQKNPDAIRRLFFDHDTAKRVSKISRHLAETKRIYRLVEPAELEKVAGTLHHGGIVAIIEAQTVPVFTQADGARWGREGKSVLVLDRIGNAHNLGALVRTAAFLGIEPVLLAEGAQQANPTEAAYRVAEGGMNHVALFRANHLPSALKILSTTHDVIGTAVVGAKSLHNLKRKPGRPVALVLGNEEHGLASDVAAACGQLVTIPGTGRVESLNVSAAAAILMWSLMVNCR